MKESHFETTFHKTLTWILNYIAENKFEHAPLNKDKKFYVIVYGTLGYLHGIHLRGFNRVSDCFAHMNDQLLEVDKEIDQYYLGIWQRHNDGTVSRVCYSENYL